MLSGRMIEVSRLHHVSFAVKDVEASRRFFGEVLGLPEIDRPPFKFRGAWYGIGDRALHLIEEADINKDAAARLGRSDHMALEVAGMDAVTAALDQAAIPYERGTNDALGFKQVFCADPDGHTIEFISFP